MWHRLLCHSLVRSEFYSANKKLLQLISEQLISKKINRKNYETAETTFDPFCK
jgi:hypothetical protein